MTTTQTDRYLVEFRYREPVGVTDWRTMEMETPTSMNDVIDQIAHHHPTTWTNSVNIPTDGHGMFRAFCLSADTGRFRDVTDEALTAYGWDQYNNGGEWPWWIEQPAILEAAE